LKIVDVEGSTLGSVITDVDLRAVSYAEFSCIEKAFNERGVLVFPGQHLNDEEQLTFGRRFGPLEKSIMAPPPGQPDGIIGIGNTLADGTHVSDPDHQVTLAMKANAYWHSDSSYKQPSANASLLSAHVLPSSGGDTEFADMRAAYDALDSETRALVDPLIASHSYLVAQARVGGTYELSEEERARLEAIEHPIVRVHGPTGRKSLFLGRHVVAIRGMADNDAIRLVDDLIDAACQPPRLYRHRWGPGDLVAWDNRCVLHRGHPWDMTEPRVLRRATVAGDADGAENVWAIE
jgi:alpha-ketoglutarate-dependent taurine dioxygenase